MFMNATILDAEVDQMFFGGVNVTLYDIDEKETYKGQIVEGLPGLADLKALKKQNQPVEVLAQAASQIAMPPVMQPMMISIRKAKAKQSFLTLVCRVAFEQ